MHSSLLRLFIYAAPVLAAIDVPIRRHRNADSYHHDRNWKEAQLMAQQMRHKYEPKSSRSKRQSNASSTVFTTNRQLDSAYSAQLAIGTPQQVFNVILDTGSSDLWLAGPNCQSCTGMPLWDPTTSSTFQQGNGQELPIRYGSGEATGTPGTDTVSMGVFTVPDQKLVIVDDISDGLIVPNVSGLMGLGFQSLAVDQAKPWWETLVEGNVWTEPLMSFYFTRFINDPNAGAVEPGGMLTLGGVNTSFFQGDVDFIDISGGTDAGFWLLPVEEVTANGQTFRVSGGSAGNVLGAIDTGTTLIGAPTDQVEQFYSMIPGSGPADGQWQGYFLYPCDTVINMTINFGSRTWSISDEDFRVSQVSEGMCAGAVFPLDTGGGTNAPAWVVGDAFLKNVYSVFRFSPPSVGFATLAAAGNGQGNLITGAAAPRSAPSLLLAAAALLTGVLLS